MYYKSFYRKPERQTLFGLFWICSAFLGSFHSGVSKYAGWTQALGRLNLKYDRSIAVEALMQEMNVTQAGILVEIGFIMGLEI